MVPNLNVSKGITPEKPNVWEINFLEMNKIRKFPEDLKIGSEDFNSFVVVVVVVSPFLN